MNISNKQKNRDTWALDLWVLRNKKNYTLSASLVEVHYRLGGCTSICATSFAVSGSGTSVGSGGWKSDSTRTY